MSIASKSAASVAAVAVGLAVAVSLFASNANAATCTLSFNTNLKMGSKGAAVMDLQKFLNMSADTQVAATGAGSPGLETSTFGGLTKAAVIKFQNKYAADVLTPNGLTVGTGYFGASSRAKASALCGGGMTTTPAGTGLTVMSATQPMNNIAPKNASRVPFTKFTLAAGNDGPVTVSSVVVKRVGPSSNSDIAGVILLDDMGNQLGTEKTFNSNYMATIGQSVTIPAGTQKTFTIAGNIPSSVNPGNVVGIELESINTTATVTGSLPIVGAMHTLNNFLSIGTITFSNSNAFSTNATTTKEIGTTGYAFTGYRLTAGSAEDIKITNLRWNQTGSVSAADLANVVTVINGTSYPTTLSADGKYYDTMLGSGVLVPKGNQVEVYIKGDVVGSNVNSRSVKFDVDKNTDIVAQGQLYGYSMSPAVAGSPFFYAATTNLQGASITSVNKENSVAAQNIALNVPNQPLGGYFTDIVGEGITVQTQKFTVTNSGTLTSSDVLTNVSLVDGNGTVVAGPVDGVFVGATSQTITFPDSVTWKPGKTVYTLRGKVASAVPNGTTYVVSSTVNSTNFTNPKGESTGNTISLPGTAITLNTMTVKAAALTVSVAATPVAQNLVAGTQDVVFTTLQFDASNSGEDARASSVGVAFGNSGNLSSCRLYDGSTNLTTGSNAINSPSSTGTFLMNTPIVVTKGTVKSLNVVCNVLSSASGNTNISLNAASSTSGISSVSATGVTSGNTISVASGASVSGNTMALANGAIAISLDSSSPSLTLAASNASGVTIGVFKLRATNENVNLVKLGLMLATGTPNDVGQVTLWANNVQVGTALFTGTGSNATQQVTLTSPLMLTKDTDVLVTAKANVPTIGTSQPGTAGQIVQLSWAAATTLNQFTGLGSGADIVATGAATSSGIRIFKSVPTVARIALPASNNLVNGTTDLFRFSVTASPAGSVSLNKITVNSTATGVLYTASTGKVVAYTDSGFSTTIGGGFTNGEVLTATTIASTSADTDLVFSAPVRIPAGATYYFRVQVDITGVDTTGDSVSTKLAGDAASPLSRTETYATIQAGTDNDFVWSGNTAGDSATSDRDWYNGNQVVGLPAAGTDSSTNTRAN